MNGPAWNDVVLIAIAEDKSSRLLIMLGTMACRDGRSKPRATP